jgi:hypothetical protein
MAEVILIAVAADHAHDPDFDGDKAFTQALTDSRRMMCEPEQCPLWVKSRHVQRTSRCPLYPQ